MADELDALVLLVADVGRSLWSGDIASQAIAGLGRFRVDYSVASPKTSRPLCVRAWMDDRTRRSNPKCAAAGTKRTCVVPSGASGGSTCRRIDDASVCGELGELLAELLRRHGRVPDLSTLPVDPEAPAAEVEVAEAAGGAEIRSSTCSTRRSAARRAR